jgi:hypothetical protein
MLNRIRGSRAFGVCATALLPLLLAFSATGCNGGPTEPKVDGLVGIYTGRWRGNINGLEVVLNVQATKKGAGGIGLNGTGTARSATGEIHPLRIEGDSFAGNTLLYLNVERGGGTGPGSVILMQTGSFDGEEPRDGRTWPGSFTSVTGEGGAPIFGPGTHSVTLTKE